MFVSLFSCKFSEKNKNTLAFNPTLHQQYYYALTKITSQQWMYNNQNNISYDTIKIGFTYEVIKDTDSLHLCKLTFNDFVLKRPPFKMTFNYTGSSIGKLQTPFLRNPFVVLDSIGYYIKGLSVQVLMSNKGIVKQVDGVDDLIDTIAFRANSSTKGATQLLADYVSSNAITDLLNRIFSVPPDLEININDMWGRKITLITKAPVNIDNSYTMNQRHGDTAYIDINSVWFARQSEDNPPFMKGNLKGNTILNYSTGMPSDIDTKSETHTTTTSYIITGTEEFKIKRLTKPS